jgi:predicted GTPase
MSDGTPASTVALSLVSHTNVGKTTLARTLLRRDIGEVRDEAHVTLAAERHTMIETRQGDRLELWDTPGFGDSVRMARRLARASNPIGWLLNEVWDRYRDRAMWSGQRAVRNVLEEADVVLYLVNASESPEDAVHVRAELHVLDLLAKPTLVLLNQTGLPREVAIEADELKRWQAHCAGHDCVRAVLALDAFARCWVQEGTLLRAVADALPEARRVPLERLRQAWQARERATFQAAMTVLANRLARAALDREEVSDAGWSGRLIEAGAALGLRREGGATPRERAMTALAQRLEADVRATTDQLIRLHGLDGHATDAVLQHLASHFALQEPVSAGKAAMFGGMVTGALAGLKADIATGGLTLGGGLLAGGLIGALSAAGLARGYNLVRGLERPTLAWTDEVLDELAQAALLGYLAVAHHGRGRGEWAATRQPAFWSTRVAAALAPHAEALQAVWARRARDPLETLAAALRPVLENTASQLLLTLYPAAADALPPYTRPPTGVDA